uniref:3-oxo-5-alpha-steroid 4-dehydrogenase C-terminal domain-containing protein n=1 Tax=Denticeps clupeoides TaxID=299321 RepID=A0AAY4B094_9TELE
SQTPILLGPGMSHTEQSLMLCQDILIWFFCVVLIITGSINFIRFWKTPATYGRYTALSPGEKLVPAKVAWFFQELPSFVVPLLLPAVSLFVYLYCGVFLIPRTFIYSLRTRGQPFPINIMATAFAFCTLNGFLQGHYLLHCATYEATWLSDGRLVTGLMLFFLGMAINIHSDCILRNLRKPGGTKYKIPRGGLFEYVSAANFLGEIMEWFGYTIATWSFPALCFAFFSCCFIVTRVFRLHKTFTRKLIFFLKRCRLIPFVF